MSIDEEQKLPRELVWAEDGHLGEIATTAIADGQLAVVPEDALAHLRTCDRCARATGEAALLSSRIAEVLASALPASERRPIPWLAIAAALAIAALGALPAMVDYPVWMREATTFVTRTVPLVVRSAIAVVRTGGGTVGPAVSFACASLLMMAGFTVARLMPRRMDMAGASATAKGMAGASATAKGMAGASAPAKGMAGASAPAKGGA